MIKLFNTISSTAEERIKNPFTGTFIASWIVFNWKPLVFFVFSKDDIVTKISFIVDNYSDHWNLLWYPLFSCLFFLFIVPYINLTNDFFTKKSKEKREDNLHSDKILKIQRETEEEEEKAKREIAIEIVREQKGRNQQIDDLRKSIEIIEKDLSLERTKNIELLDSKSKDSEKFSEQMINLNESRKKLENKFREEMDLKNSNIDEKNEEIHILQRNFSTSQNQLENERELNRKSKEDQSNLLKEKRKVEELNLSYDHKINSLSDELNEKNFLISRMKDPTTKVIKIGNRNILEYFNVASQITYYDFEKRNKIPYSEIISLMSKDNKIINITNNVILGRALDSFENYNINK